MLLYSPTRQRPSLSSSETVLGLEPASKAAEIPRRGLGRSHGKSYGCLPFRRLVCAGLYGPWGRFALKFFQVKLLQCKFQKSLDHLSSGVKKFQTLAYCLAASWEPPCQAIEFQRLSSGRFLLKGDPSSLGAGLVGDEIIKSHESWHLYNCFCTLQGLLELPR